MIALGQLRQGDGDGVVRRRETGDELLDQRLVLPDQPALDPPDQRMEPEQSFHEHMDRRRQIVPAPDVCQFMSENRPDVLFLQPDC